MTLVNSGTMNHGAQSHIGGLNGAGGFSTVVSAALE